MAESTNDHLVMPCVTFCSVLESSGLSVGLLHMGRSQMQRDEALQCFKFGITPVLVATSLASRGLDFPDVTQVINYDMPGDMGEYARRLGRLGRVGQLGVATTLFTQADVSMAAPLVVALKAARQQVPEWLDEMAVAGVEGGRRTGVGSAAANDGGGGGDDGDERQTGEGVAGKGVQSGSSSSSEVRKGGRSGLLLMRRRKQQANFGAYLPSSSAAAAAKVAKMGASKPAQLQQ
jgi:superfamily II DNA/RNA helicase